MCVSVSRGVGIWGEEGVSLAQELGYMFCCCRTDVACLRKGVNIPGGTPHIVSPFTQQTYCITSRAGRSPSPRATNSDWRAVSKL